MNDLYVFALIVVFPLVLKYLLFEFGAQQPLRKDVAICLFGEMNSYTVPIINKINKLKVPTMIAIDSLNSVPLPLLQYVDGSIYYKFVPYVNSGTTKLLVDAVSIRSNTSIVIHDTAVSYYNNTVLNPSYTVPSTQYSGMDLMRKVWSDFKQDKIHGLVLVPYTKASYEFIDEFIHDVIRFNMTINTDWYSM